MTVEPHPNPVVYVRCNGGHLFRGESCPFDGWGNEETKRLAEVVKELSGEKRSLVELRLRGFSDDLIRRVMIADFGDLRGRFDALAPEYIHIDGETLSIHEVGPEFL